MNGIYTTDKSIILPKEICDVPYRLLSPFFEDKLKGHTKVQKMIEEFSGEDIKFIYEIYKNEKNENCILTT